MAKTTLIMPRWAQEEWPDLHEYLGQGWLYQEFASPLRDEIEYPCTDEQWTWIMLKWPEAAEEIYRLERPDWVDDERQSQ